MNRQIVISKPIDCIYRNVSFYEQNLFSNEKIPIGYLCGHPNCTPEKCKKLGKDFLPCNNELEFPVHCFLKKLSAGRQVIRHGVPFICPECGKEIQYGLTKNGRKIFATSRLFKNEKHETT